MVGLLWYVLLIALSRDLGFEVCVEMRATRILPQTLDRHSLTLFA